MLLLLHYDVIYMSSTSYVMLLFLLYGALICIVILI